MIKLLFNYLIFPGFLFAATAGLFACWLDRKISARLQWRIGPPWHQSFTDIFKLLGKETIVPQGVRATFLIAPCIGLLSVVLVAAILGQAIISPVSGFSGDLIVVIYLLTIPPVCSVIGAFASRNPLASIGASREIKMIIAYELPFLLAVVAVIIKSAGVIKFSGILEHQANFNSTALSLSGALALIVCIFSVQAKLGFAPFDIPEAEQELMAGVLIEYSGAALAVFKLTKAIMLYTLPVLLTVLFFGKDISPGFLVLKFLLLLIIAVLIKNTNPRLRIDQAVRFFWRLPLVLGTAAVIAAVFGF